MKKLKFLSFLLIAIIFSNISFSQEIAITERGDSVVLYSDGSWDYYDNLFEEVEIEDFPEIRMNDNSFTKPNSSTKKVNGSNEAYEVWYNEKKWKRIPPGELNSIADISFQLVAGDVFAMIVYEELEIQVENLSRIALDNAKEVAPDMRIIEAEYRIVNNDTVIFMRMDGTTEGVKFSYYSYFFSNVNGSVQFHTFTGQTLIDKYKNDIEDLLNGFIAKE